MKNLEITTGVHVQSGRPVKQITILGKDFCYSDKRGYQTESRITRDFALKVIEAFPVKISRSGIPVLMLDRLNDLGIILKWNYLGEAGYELSIHSGGHVWASSPINS
ncbi:hypothetical protein [Flavobacterium psychrophilum]|uniref:hypothetical protein n=1 Tax=Flavobacterium psychrophilum TaxID=96345 RepID=UPI00106D0CE5|nr:hypothetical protein [Flavobacterium psychrophilum]